MSAYTEPTPRPWPWGSKPTADQLATWLAICTHAERVSFANAFLAVQDTVSRAYHDGARVGAMSEWIYSRKPMWWVPEHGPLAMIPLGEDHIAYSPPQP